MGKRPITVIFLIYSFVIMTQIVVFLFLRDAMDPDYKQAFIDFSFSDFLINYEGGFVRRGLIGELLLKSSTLFGFDIGTTILSLCIISTVALILLLIYLFRNKGLSYFILPICILLGGFAMNRLTLFRRDALMLLIIYLIFYLYKKYKDHRRPAYYVLFSVSCTIVILIHEASFFCFVPFILLHQLFSYKEKNYLSNVFRTLIFLSPAILTMLAVIIYKGDENTAGAIWNSYQPYFNEKYGEMLPVGQGVQALTWNNAQTFMFHFTTNYTKPIIQYVPRAVVWALIYFITFYLCANVNRIRLFSYEKKLINSNFLTATLLIQFISLLPMFTILSCDLRRVTIYWTITSFFIFAIFENNQILPEKIKHISKKINTLFNDNKLLSNSYFYIFVSTTIICPFAAFPLPDAFYTSVIGNLYRIAQQIYALI